MHICKVKKFTQNVTILFCFQRFVFKYTTTKCKQAKFSWVSFLMFFENHWSIRSDYPVKKDYPLKGNIGWNS